jgi:hypothetical protein
MLFSNHSDAGEQKSTTPQAALKAVCGCGATCLMESPVNTMPSNTTAVATQKYVKNKSCTVSF